MMMVAKHPPEHNDGKVSTSDRRTAKHPPDDDQCSPDDADKTSDGRHKSENSPRRETATTIKFPRRHLQEESGATSSSDK